MRCRDRGCHNLYRLYSPLRNLLNFWRCKINLIKCNCFTFLDVMQVRSTSQWWGIPNIEFWACSLPHSVQNCVGAMECLLCNGHTGHEEGERYHCCLSRYVPDTNNTCIICSYFKHYVEAFFSDLLFSTDWSHNYWICYVLFCYEARGHSWLWSFNDINTKCHWLTGWRCMWLMSSLFLSQSIDGSEKTKWHILCPAVSGGEWHSQLWP